MKKTYQLKTNALPGEQQVIDITPALGKAPVRVPAAAGARYELIDTSTKAAPDNIRVMRKGKNLHLFFDGDTEAGAVIENFYTAHTDNLPTLVGRTEQGTLYEYIPESAAPSAVVTKLGDTGHTYGMALGGQELAASAAAAALLAPAAAVLSPWLLGAGAIGAAALAGGGGGGSSGTGGTSVKPNDGKAVGLSIDLDQNNNGVINSTEKGSATSTSITATFDSSKVAAGQVLNFSDGSRTVSRTLTAADVAAGKVSITGWALPAEGQLTVKATLTDGTNPTPEASDSATLDTTAPNDGKALGLKVDLDSNANGILNGSEKGQAENTSLTATFDKSKVAVGDKVIFSDGTVTREVVLTAADVAAGQVSSAGWSLPAEDGSTTYTAVLSDAAGNTTPSAQQSLKLDAVVESLKTALTIDPVTGDNLLSSTEQTLGAVAVTGRVSGAFAARDVVTLSINGKSYTGGAAADGSYSISVPLEDLRADPDQMIEGSVTGGNNGQWATAAQGYVVQTTSNQGKVTTLALVAITSDNLINATERGSSSINVTGKVYGQFASGDTVSLLVNNKVSTGVVQTDGSYSIAIAAQDLLEDADSTIDASITGTNGSLAKAMQNYGIDTSVPVISRLSIDLDSQNNDGVITNGDGWINKAELGANTTTSLTAFFNSSEVSLGDKVIFSFSDDTGKKEVALTSDDISAGKVVSTGWTIPAEGNALAVKAYIQDSAGNRSSNAEDTATVDTQVTTFAQTTRVERGSLLVSAQFDLAAGSALEAGTYKLNLGSGATAQQSQQQSPDGKLTITGLDAMSSVAAKDIYLEFWDRAGNHSIAYLTNDMSTYNITQNTQFTVI